MNKIVKNDAVLKTNLKIAVKIKQPTIIPTIIIPPKNSPDKIIPPGTFVNLKSKVVKSPTDKSPNVIFSLLSVVIIAGNSQQALYFFAWQLSNANAYIGLPKYTAGCWH